MIRMTQNRLKQGATYELEPLEFADPLKAIVRLIQTELNYGGVIVDIDERSITVRTIVMEDVDTSIFEGSPESMKPMLQFVRYFMALVPDWVVFLKIFYSTYS
jgi:hypothetical protein